MSRLSPIETIEQLRQHLFDLPGDTAVEIERRHRNHGDDGVGALPLPWQGPVALVIHHDPGRQRTGLVRVEQP